ncbi:MAG: TIGR00266 family protein [Limisphaerales bacterium]
MQIHLYCNGVQSGPFPVEQVRQMLASGELKPTDHVFHEGLTDWVQASQSPALAPPGTPPPLPQTGAPAGTGLFGTGYNTDTRRDFEYQIEGRPDYAFVTVQVPANQTLKVEASAMATMDSNLQMKTKMRGGLARLLTGESLFVNEFTAANVPGSIGIAPGAPGDLEHVYLDGDTIFLQSSGFVAGGMGVTLDSQWQGLKGFFSGEGLFLIKCSGKGDLWFNTYGAMFCMNVSGSYVVDTGHIVAFTEGLQYQIGRIGGYKSLFFSGEGLVCKFSGHGKVWIQTRKLGAFANWAQAFRPVANSGGGGGDD